MNAATSPTLYLIVGLPGVGKTTRARQIAQEHQALRLTPDEWMLPLFGAEWRSREWSRKRDVLEGRLISTAIQALRLGTNVVLDFGFWGRDERSSLRWFAAEIGARCELIHLTVSDAEQRSRVRGRFTSNPTANFDITPE